MRRVFAPLIARSLAVFLLAAAAARPGHAQDASYDEGPYQPLSFLLVASTTRYDDALRVARSAAAALDLPLDLRGLTPVAGAKEPSLTLPAALCEADGVEAPCYVPRGRGLEDGGLAVSIELSSAYGRMRPGLYIVTAGVLLPGDPRHAALLRRAKASFPTAYLKVGEVYMGCMH
ncbi:MAG: hypothetical protein RLZZ383_1485 [Pseudomonadota bacterium]|jgi:hypothetical protein